MDDDLKDRTYRYRLILEGKNNDYVRAYFYEIKNMLDNTRKVHKTSFKSCTDTMLRYLDTRINTLEEVLELPTRIENEVDSLSIEEKTIIKKRRYE